jgi:DNA polymerase III subunit chi
MTRIDFYTLAEERAGDRLLLTCRLAQRAHDEGLRVFVETPDDQTARALDRLLWTFRDESFLPHGLVGETDPDLTPVLIGQGPGSAPAQTGPTQTGQVLINLGFEVPSSLDRFERIIEPIDHDPDVRAAGRRRYAHYKGLGYPLGHHAIRL